MAEERAGWKYRNSFLWSGSSTTASDTPRTTISRTDQKMTKETAVRNKMIRKG
jgi:hypothetical protein